MDSFAVFLCDYINMSLVVTQAMKKLFQFCSREYKCAFLEVASFGIASRLAMGLPHFIGEVLGTTNAIVHRSRHTSRASWTFSSPLVLGAICPFGYRVEHELAQDKEHSFPCRTVAIYFLQRP
jgi:hypothetical protein